MEYLFDGEFSYITIIGLTIVGVIINCIRYWGMRTFLKESERMQKSDNNSIKRIKEQFQDKLKNCKTNMKEMDVHNFVDKSVFMLKTCGFSLLSLNGICKKNIVIVGSYSVIISGCGFYMGWNPYNILLTGIIGVLCTTLLITFETGTLFVEKKSIISTNIQNYLLEQTLVKNTEDIFFVGKAEEVEENKVTEFPKPVSVKLIKPTKPEETEKTSIDIVKKIFSDALYEAAFERLEKKTSESTTSKENEFIDAIIREMLR